MAFPRLQYFALALALALASLSCGLTEPGQNGAITASATNSGILVSNQANYAVQVYAIAEDALPLWDAVQCIEGTRIEAGAMTTVPWASVHSPAAQTSNRYRVIWWRDGACSFGTDGNSRGVMVVSR